MPFDRTISRRAMLGALGVLPATRLLLGQQDTGTPSKDPATFSTGVKVVNVYANVRDKKGEIVKGLTKDDFILDEDGVTQTIRYFSQETDLPLTLGLLVDTSGSQRRLIDEERSASYRFFQQVLREEKDVAFVIHFDFEVELLQDITASRKLLEQALENLSVPQQLRRHRLPDIRAEAAGIREAVADNVRAAGPTSTTRSCWRATNCCGSSRAGRRSSC